MRLKDAALLFLIASKQSITIALKTSLSSITFMILLVKKKALIVSVFVDYLYLCPSCSKLKNLEKGVYFMMFVIIFVEFLNDKTLEMTA